jgi:hypothetical protein
MGIVHWPRESGTLHGASGMWRDLLRRRNRSRPCSILQIRIPSA